MIAETELLTNPLSFLGLCWPDIKLYDRQVEIVQSVVRNDATIVPAGNALGKDFIGAFICLWFFCSRTPCRVVTHSVDQPQLKGVLWGEMRRFMDTSRIPLPIRMGDLICHQTRPDGSDEPLSYLIGRVTRKGEGLLGHHIARTSDGVPRTLFLADEASGVDNEAWEKVDTWAHRKLAIGNPYPCQNFFYHETKKGDVKAPTNNHYFTKILKIKAEESPNVRFALRQIAAGQQPTHEILVPGVKSYADYVKHRQTWDEIRQSIGLDAQFYEGAEVLLYPPAWLNQAEEYAATLQERRKGKSMGIDSAEGGDNSSWCIVDEKGLIALKSMKTSNTNDIPGITKSLGREYSVPPDRWIFDRGGGGKEHADRLRAEGFNVQTVGFGESVSDPQKDTVNRGVYKTKPEAQDQSEERYVYVNRRAEMYGKLRLKLDPLYNPNGFGLPAKIINLPRTDGGPSLRQQLAPLPLKYDPEGRLTMPPKRKKDREDKRITITDMIGCSPDEADALVLAVYGLDFKESHVVKSLV